MKSMRNLNCAMALYAGAFVLHNADHARRGIAATPEAVVWVGTFVAMLSAVMATLVVVKHEIAPRFCAGGAAFIAVGVTLSHLLPKWGPLSDPILTSTGDGLTRVAVSCEIAAAVYLAVVALAGSRASSSTVPMSP